MRALSRRISEYWGQSTPVEKEMSWSNKKYFAVDKIGTSTQ
eukprot:CAMPEP_0172621282 /NCGR_PEP_ID=MMETSP1068-20121228/110832_1 /TAXON_ID=35684 /ORGANISM="Pseudopedinella elastica, Strain CCMP716" /LENGTH=40 /DNA_ID= /DNA_START= /DNA_END= /DNA_ORIENTATION=